MSSLKLGNNLYESANYSGRLQPKELRLGTASGTSDVWKLGFEFLTATTQRCSGVAVPGNVLNNGNVTAQVLTLPLKTTGTGSARIEYCYDDLNRISSAVESVTSPQTGGWTEAWNYDEVGNLWQTSVTGAMVNGKLTPTASSQCDRNTNRLVKSSTAQTSNDVTYTDSRGNMTSHPSLGSMTYDAEDRLMSAGTTTFAYDAEGRRVKKCVPSGVTQACTYFLYDIGGQLVAEYGANVQAQATTQYMTVDHLGSTRVVTDSAGAVVSRVDYEPFGQEIPAQGADLRSNVNGYNGASGVEVKFTGKERDAETGLDYFGARYMSSAQGRFTSADPKGFSMRTIGNPQKWNKYSYVLNNPLGLVDPDGMEEVTITYRAFIPSASVTVMGRTNGGDNRGFSTAADASHRSSMTVRIETDPRIRPGDPIISALPHAGMSTTMVGGKVVHSSTTTIGLPTATGTRDSNGTPIVNIQQNEKNPEASVPTFLTPGISANLNVMVYQDASVTQVSGTAAQFPASELNVTRADGTTTPVIQFMPPSGATPYSLIRPDRTVNERKETPACHGGDNGCPK